MGQIAAAVFALVLLPGLEKRSDAGDMKIHRVHDGLTIDARVTLDDPKVKVRLSDTRGGSTREYSADATMQSHFVELSRWQRYRLEMDFPIDIWDLRLVIHDINGKLLACRVGLLNRALRYPSPGVREDPAQLDYKFGFFVPPADGIYKVAVVILKGAGKYTLRLTAMEREMDPRQALANAQRQQGLRAALSDVDAGKLTWKIFALSRPLRLPQVLKQQYGVEAVVVKETADEVRGYNQVMLAEMERRFGDGIMIRVLDRAWLEERPPTPVPVWPGSRKRRASPLE
jgi:hypothetical protein